MKKELQDKLYAKYPKIFVQRKLSIQQSAMPWGFECGDGWYWLIDQLCECIQSYIDNNKIPQLEATQVKEKFGTLRFYTNISEDNIAGMIWFAEYLSAYICENCGSTEEVSQTTKGWIRTLCATCLNKNSKE
jgi:hypothetical protein